VTLVDLHTHSTFSDGSLSPTELVRLARRKKLSALALTDHDTVAGVPEFLSCGDGGSPVLLPGIEISSYTATFSIHLLGYGIDHTDVSLLNRLEGLKKDRMARNLEIIHRLKRLGIQMEVSEVEYSESGQMGRPHIARLLVKKGVVASVHDAFARYLGAQGAAYVKSRRIEARDAVELILSAGGVPVLAHPGMLETDEDGLEKLLLDLMEAGLQGIEVYHPSHSTSTRRKLLGLAERYRLAPTGGTDFHGDQRTGAPLGGSATTVRVPSFCFENVLDRLNRRRVSTVGT